MKLESPVLLQKLEKKRTKMEHLIRKSEEKKAL